MKISLVGVRGVPALYSGFETAATEIGMRLVERGHDVTVYCRRGYGDESEPTYRGIKKVYLRSLRVKIAETLTHTLFSTMHVLRNRPDVLLVFNPANSPICILPRLWGVPFAINVDGLEWQRTKWPWVGRAYLYAACWLSTKVAPKLIADSRAIQKFYMDRWRCPSDFATYGADIIESKSPELLHEYDLAAEDYFLVVARIEPENNTGLIVDAFRRLETDKKLVVVGGTNYKSAYFEDLKRANKDDRIRFLGPIYDPDRLNELLCNSFAYVHGHMVGGTNPILLQALGAGTCTLYLDHGYGFNREVVADAGLPFSLSPESLGGRMRELLSNPDVRQRFRELAKRRILSDYTWDLVTDQYERLCVDLAKRCKYPASPHGR